MEWAVGKLLSQDWPFDNVFIQKAARKRLGSLADKLKTENRGKEANSARRRPQSRLNRC